MEDSFRDTQGSRQKTGCGPGTAYIQGSIGAGDFSAQAPDSDHVAVFIHCCFESQILYTLQKMPGIIGEQYSAQGRFAICQHSQQETAVRDTLRTRHPDCQRSSCFFHFIIYSRNAVNFICHVVEWLLLI